MSTLYLKNSFFSFLHPAFFFLFFKEPSFLFLLWCFPTSWRFSPSPLWCHSEKSLWLQSGWMTTGSNGEGPDCAERQKIWILLSYASITVWSWATLTTSLSFNCFGKWGCRDGFFPGPCHAVIFSRLAALQMPPSSSGDPSLALYGKLPTLCSGQHPPFTCRCRWHWWATEGSYSTSDLLYFRATISGFTSQTCPCYLNGLLGAWK